MYLTNDFSKVIGSLLASKEALLHTTTILKCLLSILLALFGVKEFFGGLLGGLLLLLRLLLGCQLLSLGRLLHCHGLELELTKLLHAEETFHEDDEEYL